MNSNTKYSSFDIANLNWRWTTDFNGGLATDGVQAATLLEIYRELKKLNALLHCHNATAIPDILREISKNTTKPKAKRKSKPKARKVSRR